MSEVIPVLLLTVCFPLWIVFHYITKMKTSKGLSAEDEKMLSEVWESTNKIVITSYSIHYTKLYEPSTTTPISS